jgi:hypothetical protein
MHSIHVGRQRSVAAGIEHVNLLAEGAKRATEVAGSSVTVEFEVLDRHVVSRRDVPSFRRMRF